MKHSRTLDIGTRVAYSREFMRSAGIVTEADGAFRRGFVTDNTAFRPGLGSGGTIEWDDEPLREVFVPWWCLWDAADLAREPV